MSWRARRVRGEAVCGRTGVDGRAGGCEARRCAGGRGGRGVPAGFLSHLQRFASSYSDLEAPMLAHLRLYSTSTSTSSRSLPSPSPPRAPFLRLLVPSKEIFAAARIHLTVFTAATSCPCRLEASRFSHFGYGSLGPPGAVHLPTALDPGAVHNAGSAGVVQRSARIVRRRPRGGVRDAMHALERAGVSPSTASLLPRWCIHVSRIVIPVAVANLRLCIHPFSDTSSPSGAGPGSGSGSSLPRQAVAFDRHKRTVPSGHDSRAPCRVVLHLAMMHLRPDSHERTLIGIPAKWSAHFRPDSCPPSSNLGLRRVRRARVPPLPVITTRFTTGSRSVHASYAVHPGEAGCNGIL
ncbi:hypothetical protein C8R45DRAFT_1113306 [Mycena sanguinolenta]|nr:hypothetical protein C8R45DRAFT_1113306 [Mycena sanguinolenta]